MIIGNGKTMYKLMLYWRYHALHFASKGGISRSIAAKMTKLALFDYTLTHRPIYYFSVQWPYTCHRLHE